MMTESSIHEISADRALEWDQPVEVTSQEWAENDARGSHDKKRRIVNMYINSKSKFMASVYNIYRRFPSNPASFTLSPVVMLGHCYNCDNSIAQSNHDNNNNNNQSPKFSLSSLTSKNTSKNNHNQSPHIVNFIKDFGSLLWFSYRKEFPPIGPAAITSDIGWGCMLRTGQMMLAHVLIVHFLGRDWRLSSTDSQPYSVYRQILRLFADAPGPASPFSLHNIVSKNKAMTPTPDVEYKGEVWFAPSVIAKVLRSLVHQHAPDSFCLYVPQDGVVCIDKVTISCTQTREQGHQRVSINNGTFREGDWRSVFILIPLRLGVESLNPVYYRAVSECLKMPQSCGIIGGKPKQSFYFVGYQDENLIYLDPHIVQETVHPDKEFTNESFHSRAPQKIHLTDVDPSMAVGFYCHTKQDFENWCAQISKFEKEMDFIFSVVEKAPVYGSDDEDEDMVIM